ncbi:CopL family metal-binding regulatory protein [Luteimonas sp. XNQY3]|nr:CopL family metal-binding regulatory protein [Luteimonas sp. XNQY3]
MRPLLFRLLLCVTLLLNGIGSGMASVHVAIMEMSAGPVLALSVEPAVADCPHAGAARADATHGDRHPAAPDADDSDCMKLCVGICMQHCHVLPMALASATPVPAQLAPVTPLSAGPPSVRPHPLLRPPISA